MFYDSGEMSVGRSYFPNPWMDHVTASELVGAVAFFFFFSFFFFFLLLSLERAQLPLLPRYNICRLRVSTPMVYENIKNKNKKK